MKTLSWAIVLLLALLLAGCATTPSKPIDPACKDAPIVNSDYAKSPLGETALLMAWTGAQVAIKKATGKDVKPRFKAAAERALAAVKMGDIKAMGLALTAELANYDVTEDYCPVAQAAVIGLTSYYGPTQTLHSCDQAYLEKLMNTLIMLAT